jgi:hypothetical protein
VSWLIATLCRAAPAGHAREDEALSRERRSQAVSGWLRGFADDGRRPCLEPRHRRHP